jgi:cytochrome P450
MTDYLSRLDLTPEAKKYPLVRGWIDNEPFPFFKELRAKRPILVTPVATLVTRLDDCLEILNQPAVFSVALYKPKMADYLMAHDDDALHMREKSIMYGFLNRSDLPQVRAMVANIANGLLDAADGKIEAIGGFCRMAPATLVQEYFGLTGIDRASLIDWSYWSQIDTFHNQPFDLLSDAQRAHIKAEHDRGGAELEKYIKELMVRRLLAVKAEQAKTTIFALWYGLKKLIRLLRGKKNEILSDDVVTRMLRTNFPDAMDFDLTRVGVNAGGLLIGTIETTCQSVAQALQYLFDHPEWLVKAQAAARLDNPAEFDAIIWEATRFVPISPYLFRQVEQDYTLAKGTDRATTVRAGSFVMPMTLSAMFDEQAYADPDAFIAGRPDYPNFLFGFGAHECLGKYVGMVLIPEMLRQILRRPGLRALSTISYDEGHLPKSYNLAWGGQVQ